MTLISFCSLSLIKDVLIAGITFICGLGENDAGRTLARRSRPKKDEQHWFADQLHFFGLDTTTPV